MLFRKDENNRRSHHFAKSSSRGGLKSIYSKLLGKCLPQQPNRFVILQLFLYIVFVLFYATFILMLNLRIVSETHTSYQYIISNFLLILLIAFELDRILDAGTRVYFSSMRNALELVNFLIYLVVLPLVGFTSSFAYLLIVLVMLLTVVILAFRLRLVIFIYKQQRSVHEKQPAVTWTLMERASERHLLYFLTCQRRVELIQHACTRRILERKWNSWPRRFYNFQLFLYVVFVVSYASLISKSASRNNNNINNNGNMILSDIHASYEFKIAYPLAIMFFLLEIIKLWVLDTLAYFRSIQNIIELFNFTTCLVLPFVQSPPRSSLVDLAKVIVILLSSFILIVRLEWISPFDIYVTVMKKIFKRYFILLPLFMIVLVAFLFAFRVNSHGSSVGGSDEYHFNTSISLGLIRLVTMTLGEYYTYDMGLRDRLYNDNYINYLLYIIYLFVLPILVINIFVGISVDEVKRLIDDSHVQNNILRAQYVLKIQEMLFKLGWKKGLIGRRDDKFGSLIKLDEIWRSFKTNYKLPKRLAKVFVKVFPKIIRLLN